MAGKSMDYSFSSDDDYIGEMSTNYKCDDIDEDDLLKNIQDLPQLNPDFEMLSDDDELSEMGELEDNFVELAGGAKLKYTDDDEDSSDEYRIQLVSLPDNNGADGEPVKKLQSLPLHKIEMMDRFLFGIDNRNIETTHDCDIPAYSGCPSTTTSSLRKGRQLTDQEDFLEKQFDKLLCSTKSRRGGDSRSMISGSSVLSESLQYATNSDQLTMARQRPKNDELTTLDPNDRMSILHCVEEIDESDDITSDPFKGWIGPERTAVGSIDEPLPSNLVRSGRSKVLRIPPRRQWHPSAPETDTDSAIEGTEPQQVPGSGLRLRGETREERRLRKSAFKGLQRVRRQVKKINRTNFRNVVSSARTPINVHVTNIE